MPFKLNTIFMDKLNFVALDTTLMQTIHYVSENGSSALSLNCFNFSCPISHAYQFVAAYNRRYDEIGLDVVKWKTG